jgi:predicted tellurium resistance membrane protein TerC
MGLDNVLAVAGAAHGSVLLVVAGLVISIPIVVWGSTLILNWIERFPALLYIGGGVLAWTAAKMLADEPLLQEFLDGRPGLKTALYLALIGGVLGLAWLRNRKLAAQENARKEAMQ